MDWGNKRHNGNVTRATTYGETNDVPVSAGNRRLGETSYEYDSLNRLVRSRRGFFDVFTELAIGDGESTSTFTYAPNGQLQSETDDNGHTTRYTYDSAGRLLSVTDPRTNTVQYAYDAAGNRTQVQGPSGTQALTNYGGLRPSSMTLSAGSSAQITNLTWYPFGPRTQAKFPPHHHQHDYGR